MPDLSFFGTPSIAFALLYTGLVTTALAIYLETIALQKVSAAEVMSLQCCHY
jgi:drug/metabolite transporter (DMT)-like permease